MTEIPRYPAPLDRLFSFREPDFGELALKEMPDYVGELGLTREHVPALVEIARLWADEDSLPDEAPAALTPVHAWRALGQLRAIEAVEPLLAMQNLLDDERDDWYLSEFPHVFGQVGPAAIPALAAYLADTQNGEYPRVSAAEGLLQIAKRHPDSRDEVVAVLGRQTVQCEKAVRDLNGFLISHLVELNATEAAESIERAFAAEVVEDDICGAWGQVRRELGVEGLGLAPDEPRRPTKSPGSGSFLNEPRPSSMRGFADFFSEPSRLLLANIEERRRAAEKKSKAKRKQQEKARKRNRKRR